MQTEWRSKRLKRNAAELRGQSWVDTEAQTDDPPENPAEEAQTDERQVTQASAQTDPTEAAKINPPTGLAIDYTLLRVCFDKSPKDLEGLMVWAEIMLEANSRPIAAGRTQGAYLVDDCVEWNAELRLHLPVKAGGKLTQQIVVWVAGENRAPFKIGSSSSQVETRVKSSRIHLNPGRTIELVIGPISASVLS